MAGFRTSTATPPPGSKPHLPSFLEDFCGSLQVTYNCPRKDFHKALPPHPRPRGTPPPPCADLSYWLNLFELDGPKPGAPGTPLQAKLPTGTGNKILVTPNEVQSAKKNIKEKDALELALLAVSNPAMLSGDVEIDGTPDEMIMLAIAAHMVGLAIKNAPPMDPSKHKKIIDKMSKTWQNMHGQMDSASAAQIAGKRAQVKSDMIENTVSDPDAISALGSVDRNLYKRAKEKVWNDQAVSAPALQSDFGISARQASRIMKAMKEESFIYKDTSGRHAVCVDHDCRWMPT